MVPARWAIADQRPEMPKVKHGQSQHRTGRVSAFHVPARRGLRRRAVQLREKCITSCSKKSRRRRFAWSKPLDGIRPFLDDAPFDQVESDEADQLARPELSNAQHQLFLFVADFDGSQIVIQCRSAPAGKCMKYTWPCQAPLTILL